MKKQKEICPRCFELPDYNSSYTCTNQYCDDYENIIIKNEDYIEYLKQHISIQNSPPNGFILMEKLDEVIKVLNKITNPDVNDNNIVR